MNAEAWYLRLPIVAQNWICDYLGWRIQRSRFNAGFIERLRQCESRDHWSAEQLVNFRDERLRAFVRHAADSVPYYRESFRQHNIVPEQIQRIADLAQLPILTKPELQARQTEFYSQAVPSKQWQMTHTSGTTGGGLRFPTTLAAVQEQWATWWRFRRRFGLGLDAWCGYFGGRSVVPLRQMKPPYWRYNRPGKQILFSAYHLRPETYPHYIEELNRRQPPWLHGYPSILSLLAGHLLDAGQRLDYTPRWISIGAENLLPQQAQAIGEAFGVQPIEHYGMAEAVANISLCPRRRLHVDEDFAAVEFVPNDGWGWKIVGTNFTNPALPLLRYEVGDLVELDDAPCDCGLPGRIVRSIDGRCEDYIILKNGARLGRMDHIFKDMTSVREAQLFQDKPGVVVARIVKNDQYRDADEQRLRDEFYKRVGDQAEVQFEYVAVIPRTRSGKLRFVISNLPDGRLSSAAN